MNKADIKKLKDAVDKHKDSSKSYCSKIIYDFNNNMPIDSLYQWKSIKYCADNVYFQDLDKIQSTEQTNFIDPQAI